MATLQYTFLIYLLCCYCKVYCTQLSSDTSGGLGFWVLLNNKLFVAFAWKQAKVLNVCFLCTFENYLWFCENLLIEHFTRISEFLTEIGYFEMVNLWLSKLWSYELISLFFHFFHSKPGFYVGKYISNWTFLSECSPLLNTVKLIDLVNESWVIIIVKKCTNG